jgi:hypothetical protein
MEQKARRNLKVYPVVRIFTKRVYLPLIAIYFINVVGLSLSEIGFLAAFIGLVQLIIEVPTGYFSDKISRKYSYILGGVIGMIATLFIVFMQNKTGVFIGMFFETVAYALFSGTGQALVHDSLSVLGREKDYSKYSSRTQSVSLLANAVIIALVPLSYTIDARLPFVFGTLQFFALVVTCIFLSDVRHEAIHNVVKPVRVHWLKGNKEFITFALVFGMFAAIYTSPSDFRNLALEAYGIRPELLGLYFAAASVVGAILGLFIHKLKELGLKKYAMLDSFIAVAALAGLSMGSPYIAVGALILNMSFWRYRGIIYQDFILAKYRTKYKATLMSVVHNAEQLNKVWQPAAIGLIVGIYGLQTGFLFVAAFAALLAIVFVKVTVNTLGSTE